MRSVWPVVVGAAVALAAVPAAAQQRARGGRLGQNNWVQLHLAAGRIALATPYLGRGGAITSQTSGDGVEERLTINTSPDGSMTVDYEVTTADARTTVRLTGGGEVSIVRAPRGEGGPPRLEFAQLPGRPLSLSVANDGQAAAYEGPTLWHLLLAAPAPVGDELAPILNSLNAQWDLAEMGQRLEAALLDNPRRGRVPRRGQWAQWVAQLAERRFAARQAADRALRAAGADVLPYLESLDGRGLDAEQRHRIDRIVRALGRERGDAAPEQVAAWLAWEPQVWLVLLSREDEALRRRAAAELEVLLERPIAFDPAADPATRAAQVEALRAELAAGW